MAENQGVAILHKTVQYCFSDLILCTSPYTLTLCTVQLSVSYMQVVLTVFRKDTLLGYYVNSADSVQMPRKVVSDQGLHCLLTEISMENTVKMITSTRNPLKLKWTHSNDKDGHIHWSKEGLNLAE